MVGVPVGAFGWLGSKNDLGDGAISPLLLVLFMPSCSTSERFSELKSSLVSGLEWEDWSWEVGATGFSSTRKINLVILPNTALGISDYFNYNLEHQTEGWVDNKKDTHKQFVFQLWGNPIEYFRVSLLWHVPKELQSSCFKRKQLVKMVEEEKVERRTWKSMYLCPIWISRMPQWIFSLPSWMMQFPNGHINNIYMHSICSMIWKEFELAWD